MQIITAQDLTALGYTIEPETNADEILATDGYERYVSVQYDAMLGEHLVTTTDGWLAKPTRSAWHRSPATALRRLGEFIAD